MLVHGAAPDNKDKFGPRSGIATAGTPLQQVLRNLISNALTHHDRSAGQVEVTAGAAGALIEFCVSDDGPGIPPAYQERIFRMFETLRPRDVVEGSGMGLAIVKRTIEGFGGQIKVESNGVRGAAFRFTWPEIDRACHDPRSMRSRQGEFREEARIYADPVGWVASIPGFPGSFLAWDRANSLVWIAGSRL